MSKENRMPSEFNHGYALLIGVGQCEYPAWSLPVTVKDMQALKSILVDPALCAYVDDKGHVRLLHDDGASRDAILDGLAWLKGQIDANKEATAVVYYSGHGWRNKATGNYFLIPSDVKPFDVPNSALPAKDFTEALRQIPAQRLLVFIDSCHAEGMATAKDEPAVDLPPDLEQTALPKGLVDELKRGEGRAVFTSSRGSQRSWVRPDGAMSIYTYHLIEALQGAGNQPGDTVVKVSNLMNHLSDAVPASAQKMRDAEQEPFFDLSAEDFPVAMLRGGKGLPAGGWDIVKQEAEATIESVYHAEVHGSGAIAQGPGAVSAGEGGIAVGRDVHGGIQIGSQRKETKNKDE
jgi:uncharacterized caspase-like protein